MSADQLQAIGYAESAWSSFLVSNPNVAGDSLDVKLNFVSNTEVHFQGGPPTYTPVYPVISQGTFYYPDVLQRLDARATSATDATALATLHAGSVNVTDGYFPAPGVDGGFSTRSNYSVGPTPTARTMASALVALSTAQARNLGLTEGDDIFPQTLASGADADVYLLNSPNAYRNYYYGPANTATPAGMESYTRLVMVAIGQSLGFITGLSTLETARSENLLLADQPAGPYDYSIELYLSSLDLFRYKMVGGKLVRSIELGQDATAFSIDGQTALAMMHTGATFGDGYFGNQWVDAAGLMSTGDYFDQGSLVGLPAAFSSVDAAAFDAMGYTIDPGSINNALFAGMAVPEPGFALLAMVAPLSLRRHRGRRG